MGNIESINTDSSIVKNFIQIEALTKYWGVDHDPLEEKFQNLANKAGSLFQKYNRLTSTRQINFDEEIDLQTYLQPIDLASQYFLKSAHYIYEHKSQSTFAQIRNFFYMDFSRFLDQVTQFAMTLDEIITIQMNFTTITSISLLPLEISIFNFSFHVEELENHPFYQISQIPAYNIRQDIFSQNQRIFNVLGAHGSGKSNLVPLFLTLRSIKRSMEFEFIIVVKPETSQIRNLIQIYDTVCNEDPDDKMYSITSSLPELLELKAEKQILPVIAVLSPFETLRFIKSFNESDLLKFMEKACLVIDDILTRTVEVDILVQDLSRVLYSHSLKDKHPHLVLLSTISDQAYNNSLNIKESVQIHAERKNGQRHNVKCQTMNNITNQMLNKMREVFDHWKNELTIDIGSVIVFAPNARKGPYIIKTLKKIYQKQNGLNVVPIQVNIRPKESIDSFYQRVFAEVSLTEAERGENQTLFLLLIDISGHITPEQVNLMQSRLPIPLMEKLSRVYVTTAKNESQLAILDATVIFDSTIIELDYYDINKEVNTIKETLIPQSYCDQHAQLLNPMTSDTAYYQFDLNGVERPIMLPPSISRINLSQSIFSLLSLGIDLYKQMNLPTPPNRQLLDGCIRKLLHMGILSSSGVLSETGKNVVKYATLSPEFALATSHFNEKPEFAFLCSAIIENATNLIENPQSELLCKHFCHFSDMVTILNAIYEISTPEMEVNIENSGFIVGTLYAIYTMMGNTFGIANGLNLVHETLHWASSQEGGILAMTDKFVSLLNQGFLEKRIARFSCIIGAEPGSDPALVFKSNDVFKFKEDDASSEILFSQRPGWNGLKTPGDIVVLSLEIEESHNLNRGKLLHRIPPSIEGESTNPGVASLEVTNPSLNSIFFVSLFEAYFSNEPISTNFISINHDESKSTKSSFLIHMTQNNKHTYLNYCPRTTQVEEVVKEAVQILQSLMPFVPKSVILKNDSPLCAIEVLGTDTGNSYNNSIIIFTDPNVINVIPYPLNNKILRYAANHIAELRKTFSQIRFAVTGESIYYKFVNGRQKEAELSYPDAYPTLTSVFDDHFPSHLILLVDKNIADKPDVPQLNWISTTPPPAETLTTNVGETDSMVDATTSLMGSIGYSEKAANIFYIALNNGFPTVAEGEVPPDLAKLLNYDNTDRSIKCGLHVFLSTIINRYTKGDRTEPNPIPIKALSSTNHCTKYGSEIDKNQILEQINNALTAKFGLGGDAVNSIFLGNSLLVLSIANLPPELVAHPVSTNVWDDSYHRSKADQIVMDELSRLSVPATDIVEIPSISITVLHMRHMKLTPESFVSKVQSVTNEFGFLVASNSEGYELPSRPTDDELHGVLGQYVSDIIGCPVAVSFATRATTIFPVTSREGDSLGITMTRTMAQYHTALAGGAPAKILFKQSAKIIPANLVGKFTEIVSRRVESGKKDWKFYPQSRLLIYPTNDESAIKTIMKENRNPNNEVQCQFFCPDDPPIPMDLDLYMYHQDGTITEHGVCHECMRQLFLNMEGLQMMIDPVTHIVDKSKIKDLDERLAGFSIFDPSTENEGETWPVIPIGQYIWTMMMCDPDGIGAYLKIWFTITVDYSIRKNKCYFTCCPDHPDYLIFLAKPPDTTKCTICHKFLCKQCNQWHVPGDCKEKFHLPPGFRICPACKNVIEKTEACNHLACRCGQHFCYYCGFGPTPDSHSIYTHLKEKHQNYFNDPPDYKKYCKGQPVSDEELNAFYAQYPQFRPD